MTLQARIVLNLIGGALGGFLAWALIDLTGWFTPVLVSAASVESGSPRFWLLLFLGGILGGTISLLLGLVDALGVDSYQQRVRGLLTHGVVGFFGGALGIYFGQGVWAVIGPHAVNPDAPGLFVQTLIGKAFGWAFVGAGVGVAQGLARRSTPLIKQGLFGGFTGGLVGGIIFQSAATALNNPSLARLLGFVCIGASTGFFIGLIQTLFKQAWIRVILGRNEGKEYLIDKPVMVIGRSELADIGLFGNAKIMPEHCAIEQIQGRFRLKAIQPTDAARRKGAISDIKVNGLTVNPDVWLTDGDGIAIDDRKLLFRERLARKSDARPLAAQPVAVSTPSTAKPVAVVRVIEGAEVGRTYPLGDAPALIGRTDDCTIALSKDTLISRRHATLQCTDGQWAVTDSGGANGTFVNNTRLEPKSTLKVRAGDHIRIGETVLRLEL
jgi:pSer/pThr/pTyr-binding forkhead associated (FHA) protein